jgi:ABC-type arginine transport system ATPase subunit
LTAVDSTRNEGGEAHRAGCGALIRHRSIVGELVRAEEHPWPSACATTLQWQRLALARTLMRGDRDLLVLDEPSAGMDAEAE